MSYAERRNGKLTGRFICDAEYQHADGSTTRYHKAFPSKAEADGVEAYYRTTGQVPSTLAGSGKTFANVAAEFKTRNKAWLEAHDGKTNAQRLEFAITHLGDLDIKHVRTRELETYRDKVIARAGRKGKSPANRTINYYLDAVGKVLEFALERDDIPARPVMPRMDNTGKDRDAIAWAIEDAIVRSLEARNKSGIAFVVRVLAATGLRAGELQKLKPEQIETPAEQDDNCGIMLSEKQTKTKAARWTPIPRAAAEKLRALIVTNRLPMQHVLYDAFKQAVRDCGESSDLTIHCLRHTTITRLLQSGAHPTDVAKITGHIVPGTVKMQLRYYHPDKSHLFSVAKILHARLGENPNTSAVVDLNQFAKQARSA